MTGVPALFHVSDGVPALFHVSGRCSSSLPHQRRCSSSLPRQRQCSTSLPRQRQVFQLSTTSAAGVPALFHVFDGCSSSLPRQRQCSSSLPRQRQSPPPKGPAVCLAGVLRTVDERLHGDAPCSRSHCYIAQLLPGEARASAGKSWPQAANADTASDLDFTAALSSKGPQEPRRTSLKHLEVTHL